MRKQGWRGGARPLSEQWDGLAAGRLAARASEAARPGPPTIASDFQPVYDLDALGTAGFKVSGAASNDFAGRNVSEIGDVNGDGFDDFAITAPYVDYGEYNGGAVYVIFGKPGLDLADIELEDMVESGDRFVLVGGEPNGGGQVTVCRGGDVNRDGIDDLTVTFRNSEAGGPDSGASIVFLGRASFDEIYLLDQLAPADGTTVLGPESGYCGDAAAADMDGDGFEETAFACLELTTPPPIRAGCSSSPGRGNFRSRSTSTRRMTPIR